jgi:Glycosyltransferase (GlcNAc)
MPARIFLSIAAYCDPLLPFTLQRAVATAAQPERLHFGVVEQVEGEPSALAPPGGSRLSVVHVPAREARGPCWARALCMSLYDGEEWFLQLDSHMDFDAGWDERLVAQATELGALRRGLVISSYPNAFAFEGGAIVRRPTTDRVLAHVVKPGGAFAPDHPVLSFEAHPVDTDQPVAGFHLGAGCLFAPGAIVQAFPYDPWFYFHGEEQALALRLYTHGWDLFHMPGLPIYHLYNNPASGAPARPMHWDSAHEAQRDVSWWTLEQRSRQRLAALVAGAPLGVYGLGRQRSVAEYAAFSGIDYTQRKLAPPAFVPRAPA